MRKPIPKSVRKQVYAKYNGHCAYCGCAPNQRRRSITALPGADGRQDVQGASRNYCKKGITLILVKRGFPESESGL